MHTNPRVSHALFLTAHKDNVTTSDREGTGGKEIPRKVTNKTARTRTAGASLAGHTGRQQPVADLPDPSTWPACLIPSTGLHATARYALQEPVGQGTRDDSPWPARMTRARGCMGKYRCHDTEARLICVRTERRVRIPTLLSII